jgi:hypothetical protein
MQKENPTWSAQRIQGELAKLGLDVSDNTVAKYMRKPKTDPEKCQRWLAFLRNHAKYTVGIDFLVARTILFKSIYVFVAISHDRRKILHFGVSSKPHRRDSNPQPSDRQVGCAAISTCHEGGYARFFSLKRTLS